jgi:hypothetical protein
MTLSALGIFSAAGAGGVVSLSDYELIETQILGSNTSTVTFSSLGTYSSTYKHLQVRLVARGARSASDDGVSMRLNADTGANYSMHFLFGNGSSVQSFAQTSQTGIYIGNIMAGSSTANRFTPKVIDILDAYSASKNKTTRTLGEGENNIIALSSGAWYNTASVTSISVIDTNGDFVSGSRFSLYGIKG